MTVTWPPDVELEEARRELGRARYAHVQHERAEGEGRVANHGLWRHTLRKSGENVARLEAIVADLERRLEEEP